MNYSKAARILARRIISRPQLWCHQSRVRWRFGTSLAEPEKLIQVDPSDIKYKLVPYFTGWAPSPSHTYVRGGDWDRRYIHDDRVFPSEYDGYPDSRALIPIENLDWYRSFEDHFERGVPWKDTLLYQRRVEEGFNTSRYDSKEGLRERLEDIEALYEHMSSEGYRTQAELSENNDFPLKSRGWQHEVRIDIGRSGEPILDDGRNRLIIAKLLDIDSIPVRVLVRHEMWQEIRYKLANSSPNDSLPEAVYTHLGHPDLSDVNNDNQS